LIPQLDAGTGTYHFGFSGNVGNVSTTHPFTGGAGLDNAPYLQAIGSTTNPLFSQVRLVAGTIEVSCLASALNTAGEMVFGFAPQNQLQQLGGVTGAPNISMQQLKNLPGSVILPLPKVNVAKIIYVPGDASFLNFRSSFGTISQATDLGAMYLAVYNMSATTIQFDYTWTFHYEVIPNSAVLSYIDTLPELNDPLQLADALNKIKGQSTTGNLTTAMNAKSGMIVSDALHDFSVGVAGTIKYPPLVTCKQVAPNHLGVAVTQPSKVVNGKIVNQTEKPMFTKVVDAIIKWAPKVLAALL
jgi:hypothetical protein